MQRHPSHDNSEPGSIVAALMDFFPGERKVVKDLRFSIEAFVLTMVSIYAIRLIGVPESGLVGIVLSSAAMIPRLNQILSTNRERIWSEEGNGRRVNLDSIISGLSIFSGMFIGFVIIGIASSDADLV